MNLSDALSASAARAPERTAVVFRDRLITYRELDDEANRIAAALLHLGVEAGDRIALWLPNHPAFVSAMYGSWRVGAIVVPVHAMLTEPEARHILEDSGARVMFCAEPHYGSTVPALRAALPSLDQVVVVGAETQPGDLTYAAMLESGTGDFPAVEVADDHLALIQYTSGTAGLPKGAMLTHLNLSANLEQMRATPLTTRSDDVTLCLLPLFHIFGLNVVLNLSILEGAEVVLLERFDAADALTAVREHQVTVIAGAPPAYVAWLHLTTAAAADFSSVRVAVSGAAPLPAEVLEGFKERFGVTIWEGYGLTETSPAVTSSSVGGTVKAGSIGRPIPGVEVRLADEDGEDVEDGDPGEVLVRGPNVFRGYWQQPEATAEAFRDGWFRTGDVAVTDDEGDLFIVDRKRDLILVSGFNVYPLEVEIALADHPMVDDCAVVGVPDPYTGERVKALVVVRPGADATEEELIAHCRARLAPYKVPSVVEFRKEIPRNAAGKVLRRTLRD